MATEKKKAKPRLKKGPDIQDYVVETIFGGSKAYNYLNYRSEAREVAKDRALRGADRVRVFKINYVLVSDTKRKAKKAK